MSAARSEPGLRAPDPAAWDSLVAAAKEATVFHTAAWGRLWAEEWADARWEVLAAEEGPGYAAGIPAIVRRRGPFRVVYSMPFATYGGPLVRAGPPDPARIRRRVHRRSARSPSRR